MGYFQADVRVKKYVWVNKTVIITGISTAFIGAVNLLFWYLGYFDTITPEQKFIPMADETALLFFIFGFAVAFYGNGLFNRMNLPVIRFAALLIGIIAILILLDIGTGNLLNIRNFLGRQSGSIRGIQSGTISGITAICFLLLSAALFLLQQGAKQISVLFSSGTLIVVYLVLVGYAYGVPFLYGGTTIPMAWPTAFMFLISSAGLLIGAGKETIPVRYFVEKSVRARLLRILVPVVFILSQIQSFFLSLYSGKFGSYFALINGISGVIMLLISAVIIVLISRSVGTSIDNNFAERNRMEGELQLKTEQLAKVNAEKDRYFSIIAHDLRSPFSGFLGLTEVMAKESPQMTNSEITEISSVLHRSANNLNNLLGNLLEWSYLQRGFTNYLPVQMLLKAKLCESLMLTFEAANTKGIIITTDIPEELSVSADPNMFDSIIRNIVNNAVKFTPAGGQIEISAKLLPDDFTEISVQDTGIGMSRKLMNDLFQIDINTSRSGTEGERSTGLGLIICKEFIEHHFGRLWIESEEGKGTVFRFTLPSELNGTESKPE